ncbi:MAG TPA: hypothetical protein VI233_01975 [Puia sp.]
MRTSDTFDFGRWRLLVSRHWAENRKQYGLFLLAGTGVLLAWYGFFLMVATPMLIDLSMQFVTYFVGLYLSGFLYAGTLFSELGSKRDGTNFLLLPASQLEKLLCVLLFGVVIFFAGYTLIYYLVDIPMVQLSNRMLEKYPRAFPNSTVLIPPSSVYNIFTGESGPIPEREIHLFLMGFFSIQAVFILGPVYFTRYAFIKSILAVLTCLLLVVIVEAKLINLFLPAGWSNLHFSWVQYDDEGHPSRFIYLPGWQTKLFTFLIQFGVPVLIWTITYFKLREKQI